VQLKIAGITSSPARNGNASVPVRWHCLENREDRMKAVRKDLIARGWIRPARNAADLREPIAQGVSNDGLAQVGDELSFSQPS
jgi:hypothetical protein